MITARLYKWAEMKRRIHLKIVLENLVHRGSLWDQHTDARILLKVALEKFL
jgi:hypothetical protein